MNRNKTIRTLFALFCVLVLTFALAATAFADSASVVSGWLSVCTTAGSSNDGCSAGSASV